MNIFTSAKVLYDGPPGITTASYMLFFTSPNLASVLIKRLDLVLTYSESAKSAIVTVTYSNIILLHY